MYKIPILRCVKDALEDFWPAIYRIYLYRMNSIVFVIKNLRDLKNINKVQTPFFYCKKQLSKIIFVLKSKLIWSVQRKQILFIFSSQKRIRFLLYLSFKSWYDQQRSTLAEALPRRRIEESFSRRNGRVRSRRQIV